MISTDLPQLNLRLPPLSGLLDDTLGQALRARKRRLLIADHPGRNLAALRVLDRDIDQAVKSASVYGSDAALQLDARIAAAKDADLDAAVFLRIALAVQTQDRALFDLTAQYAEQCPRAVFDACWFYPAPFRAFDGSSKHIVTLFERSDAAPQLRLLALKLAGRCGVKALLPQIEPLQDDPHYAADAHFALACMGVATDKTKRFVTTLLAADDSSRYGVAMDIAAADPRLADDAALKRVIDADPDKTAAHAIDSAWAILTSRHPRRQFEQAQSASKLPDALMLRTVALTGYMDGVIAVCAAIAQSEGAITPMQADVLQLVLGKVPVEARSLPNEPSAKSKALRELILKVCRQTHIPLCNDADIGPWEADAILAKPEKAGETRLRNGRILRDAVPALDGAAIDVTHGLRQWLYIERAATGRHALSLSAQDIARRQELALMVGELADDFSTV